MAIHVGCAIAVARARYQRRMELKAYYDPDLEEFRKFEKFIKSNLTCTIEFSKEVIPPSKGRIPGVMVLEAKEDIEHTGIFIMMKGLPISDKKKRSQEQREMEKKPSKQKLTELRFPVLDSPGIRETTTFQIDGRSRESYPVELVIPDELPIPLLTSRGKLIYRMYVCIAMRDRHVVVGETSLRWQGYKRLEHAELKKEPKIEQQVHSKRALMGLGWRRSAFLEWKVEKGGYFPGERITVELWGECRDRGGLDIECKVELVQKVWYQVPSGIRGVQMWTKMKINGLTSGGTQEEEVISVMDSDEGDVRCNNKKFLWFAKLRVPRRITPTVRFNFMNSVSYTIRASVGVAGESDESWVTGEVPILVGNSKAVGDGYVDLQSGDEEEGEDDEQEGRDTRSSSLSPTTPAFPCNAEKSMCRPRSGSTGSPLDTRSRSRPRRFIPSWSRSRAGSVSSMESSTLSLFRFPPSYSQLSSRRPTLETLPPAYCELELQEQGAPSMLLASDQTDENTEIPDMSDLGLEEDTKWKES